MTGPVETTTSFSITIAWKISGLFAFSPSLLQTSTQAPQKMHLISSMMASLGHLTPLALSSAGRGTISIQVTGQALAQAEQPVQRSFKTKIRLGIRLFFLLNDFHFFHARNQLLGFFFGRRAFDALSAFSR